MSSNAGATAQASAFNQEQYAKQKESEQLAALAAEIKQREAAAAKRREEIEGGYGGQEDLEDRYATTSGEH
ncbi:hypothetical protein AURDEDRAFT_157862 [Auricularia subglabra TFB-10046 SS5]|nr:hypothetical protein AURDEDRAFT_157862 [Auricularia subglabra TFB-10046 SS5]